MSDLPAARITPTRAFLVWFKSTIWSTIYYLQFTFIRPASVEHRQLSTVDWARPNWAPSIEHGPIEHRQLSTVNWAPLIEHGQLSTASWARVNWARVNWARVRDHAQLLLFPVMLSQILPIQLTILKNKFWNALKMRRARIWKSLLHLQNFT